MPDDDALDLGRYTEDYLDNPEVDLAPYQVTFEAGQTKNYSDGETWDEPWALANSSNVGAFRRSNVKGLNLQVWFLNGRVYEYLGAGHLYASMLAAPSRGEWVWKYLRRGEFLYERQFGIK